MAKKPITKRKPIRNMQERDNSPSLRIHHASVIHMHPQVYLIIVRKIKIEKEHIMYEDEKTNHVKIHNQPKDVKWNAFNQ